MISQYSDYIVFVDESGSPVLQSQGTDTGYPIFVLAFIIVRKTDYINVIEPSFKKIKFEFMGHDQVIFHERDIRRQAKDFAFLQTDQNLRNIFIDRVNHFILHAPFYQRCVIIDKLKHKDKYSNPWDPYSIALHLGLERIVSLLKLIGSEENKKIHVVFESRGSNEDRRLELTFRRYVEEQDRVGYRRPPFKDYIWESLFVEKKSNCTGLQLADLIARPTGLKYLRPDQPNRAYEIIVQKKDFYPYKAFP